VRTEELVTITPSHVQGFNQRREVMVIESVRERLIAQGVHGAAVIREPRLVVPADALARLVAALRAWRCSPSVVPAT
jgi:hypothetical protein